MSDRELMRQALDVMLAAIKAGDWKVDGACDPDMVLEALRARLEKWTADDTAYRPGGLPQAEQELVAWSRVNMNDHKEGDLGIGTKPYAAQAAIVAQQTQGRMYVDPVTGDVGIGTVKSQRGWQGLTEDDAIQLLPVMPYEYDVDVEMILKFAEAIETKLKENNNG